MASSLCSSSRELGSSMDTEINNYLQVQLGEESKGHITKLGNEVTNSGFKLQEDKGEEPCNESHNNDFELGRYTIKNEENENVLVKEEVKDSDEDLKQNDIENDYFKDDSFSLNDVKMEADLEVNKEHLKYSQSHDFARTFDSAPRLETSSSKKIKKSAVSKMKHKHLSSNNKSDAAELTCTFCGKMFKAVCDLKRHIVQHTGERAWQCEVCAKSFGRKDGLTRHMLTHSDSSEQVFYICNVCGKKLTSSRSRNIHELSHTGQFLLHCEECSKGFNENSALEKHKIKEHGGSYSNFCEKCGKGFLIQRALNAHSQRCGDIKPKKKQIKGHHPCYVCNKIFNRKCNLERHLKMHRGEKDYFCDQCGKEFTDYRSVNNHMKKKHEIY